MSALYSLPRETLAIICDKLLQPVTLTSNHGYTYDSQADLVALSTTSQLLHEHAINAIWNTLPDFSMLIYTLPRDSWTAEVTPRDHEWSHPVTRLSIVRPLVAADFTRFKHYAWRVKRIMQPKEQGQNHQSPPSVLKALADAFKDMPGETMLPNLHTLRLQALHTIDAAEQEIFFRSVDVLYGPKLRDFLGITDDAPLDACDASLARLTEVCPNLLSFNIEPVIWRTDFTTSVSRTLCSFKCLDDVRTGSIPISPEAFLHLAKLDSLQVLESQMELDKEDQFRAMFENSEDKGYFPELLEISLAHQSSLALPAVMLRAVSSPDLYSVEVKIREGQFPRQAVQDIFTLVASRTGNHCMRSVKVSVSDASIGPGEVCTLDTIEPLLTLPKLTSVTVHGFEHYAIDNYALFVMATAWPDLQDLDLVPDPSTNPQPLATLAGLVPFAQHCPELRSLGVALNTDPQQIPHIFDLARPGFGLEQRQLVELEVGRSPIEDPIVVAAFLSDLFPELRVIENDFACEEDAWEEDFSEEERQQIFADAVFGDRWFRAVFQYLPQFVMIREQERKWGRKVGRKSLPSMKIVMGTSGTRRLG